jgi:hypothetical protein
VSTVEIDYGLVEEQPEARRRRESDDPTATQHGELPFLREGTPENPGKTRRIWRNVNIEPDPFNEGRFYLLQELAGEWKHSDEIDLDYEVSYHPRETVMQGSRPAGIDPPITRVIYAEMNKYGRVVNLFHGASQGQGGDPFSHLREDGDA